MKAQRAFYPSFNASIHPALKPLSNLHFRELKKQAIKQKVHLQDMSDVVLSEVEHFEKGVGEVFCLVFQI